MDLSPFIDYKKCRSLDAIIRKEPTFPCADDTRAACPILIFALFSIMLIAVGPSWADRLPFPEPANENAYAVPMENLRLRLWAQYRVLYNASNIPSGINSGSLPTAGTGPGKLNYGDTTSYDFFRQRMRLAFDKIGRASCRERV